MGRDLKNNVRPFTLQVYKDDVGEWRWRLRSGNGLIVADSAEGYKSKGACKKIALKVMTSPWQILEQW